MAGAFSSGVLLHADGQACTAHPKSAHSPHSRAPGSHRQVLGDYSKCEEQLKTSQGVGGTPGAGQLERVQPTRLYCLPKVVSQQGSPKPRVPSSQPASCPWEPRRLSHFQPGMRQGGGRRRIYSSKNWIQMGKPIWPKVETSAVQQPKMRSRALACPAAPQGSPTTPIPGAPKHYPRPHSLLTKRVTWPPAHTFFYQTHFRKIMQKPWLWVSGLLLSPSGKVHCSPSLLLYLLWQRRAGLSKTPPTPGHHPQTLETWGHLVFKI